MSNICDRHQGELMAFLEGALDAQSAAHVREHLALCAACRAEYEAFDRLGKDLEGLGEALVEHVAPVDLVQSVLDAVAEEEQTAPRVVPFGNRSRRGGMRWPTLWPRWAAAAALVLLVALVGYQMWGGFGLHRTPGVAPGPGPSQPVVPPGVERPGPNVAWKPGTTAARDKVEEANKALNEALGKIRRPKPEPFHATELADLDTVRADDVIQALKANLTDDKGVSWLKRWATLSPEQAKKIIEGPNVPDDAIVIASASLKPDEAQQALLKVVGRMPDNPYPRLELAKAYAEEQGDPEAAAAAASQLEALRQLDPENGVVYGLEALLLLDQGDLAGALDALARLRETNHASAYSLQEALARNQALVASGLDPETARLLSAFTAGSTEADFLHTLSQRLLDYGQSYADRGDLESARQIGEAVSALGQQVTQSAQLSRVEYEGTQMQEAAVRMLMGVYTALESVDQLGILNDVAQNLNATLDQLVQFMNDVGQLLQSQMDPDWFRRAGDLILRGGDLNILQLL